VEVVLWGPHSSEREHGWLSSGLLHRIFWYKFTDVSEVIMEAASTSETSLKLPPDHMAQQLSWQPYSIDTQHFTMTGS
jgi:hypothetical protein